MQIFHIAILRFTVLLSKWLKLNLQFIEIAQKNLRLIQV
jgi:hypothetical protein